VDDYLKAQDFAKRWNISTRQVELLCKQGRIKGSRKFGAAWAIPKDTQKPDDLRKIRGGNSDV